MKFNMKKRGGNNKGTIQSSESSSSDSDFSVKYARKSVVDKIMQEEENRALFVRKRTYNPVAQGKYDDLDFCLELLKAGINITKYHYSK
jgi:hypothetical protein